LQGGTAYIQAGGGVVYDSVPREEYEESVNKARALVRAILIAETQLEPVVPIEERAEEFDLGGGD
jgi:anthranilate synthase component 1